MSKLDGDGARFGSAASTSLEPKFSTENTRNSRCHVAHERTCCLGSGCATGGAAGIWSFFFFLLVRVLTVRHAGRAACTSGGGGGGPASGGGPVGGMPGAPTGPFQSGSNSPPVMYFDLTPSRKLISLHCASATRRRMSWRRRTVAIRDAPRATCPPRPGACVPRRRAPC